MGFLLHWHHFDTSRLCNCNVTIRSFLVINVCNQGKTLCSPCKTILAVTVTTWSSIVINKTFIFCQHSCEYIAQILWYLSSHHHHHQQHHHQFYSPWWVLASSSNCCQQPLSWASARWFLQPSFVVSSSTAVNPSWFRSPTSSTCRVCPQYLFR